MIATVGDSGNNAKDYAGHEINSSSHNETKQDFSNYTNHSFITWSSDKMSSETIDVDKTADFDYAAEMKHFEPTHLNLTYQNGDRFSPVDKNDTIVYSSETNHANKTVPFHEIEKILLKKKELGKRLKGSQNVLLLQTERSIWT